MIVAIGREENFLIGIQFRKVFLVLRILQFYGVKLEMMIRRILRFKKYKKICGKHLNQIIFKVIKKIKICFFI